MINKLRSSGAMAVEHLIATVYQGMQHLEVAIDIGANEGFHSVRLAKLPAIKKVIVVEANPALIPFLRTKLVNYNKVKLLDLAVTPSPVEHITMRVSSKYHGRGGIKGLHIWEKIDPEIQFDEVEVGAITLDKLIENNAGLQLDFLKMDIEGPEISILMNADIFWKMNAITVLENSVHGPAIARVDRQVWIDFVVNKGFVLVDFNLKEIHTSKELRGFNHVWLVPRNRLTSFIAEGNQSYTRWLANESA